MSGYMFHDEMVKRMMKSTVNHDAQILETAYETGRKQGQMENIKAVLEIIELNKFCKHNDSEQAKEWNKWLDDLTSDVKALKGEQE